jgi:hypothetical protein
MNAVDYDATNGMNAINNAASSNATGGVAVNPTIDNNNRRSQYNNTRRLSKKNTHTVFSLRQWWLLGTCPILSCCCCFFLGGGLLPLLHITKLVSPWFMLKKIQRFDAWFTLKKIQKNKKKANSHEDFAMLRQKIQRSKEKPNSHEYFAKVLIPMKGIFRTTHFGKVQLPLSNTLLHNPYHSAQPTSERNHGQQRQV